MPESRSGKSPGIIERARESINERLRWRLGFYQHDMLPALPEGGLAINQMRLRPYTEAELDSYAALLESAGAELAAFSSFGDSPERWLERVRSRVANRLSPYELAIVLPGESGDEFLGAFYMSRVHDDGDSVEVGFLLTPAVLGKGLGPRAARGILRWLADSDVHRVETRHSIQNTVACRAAAGIGMRKEGIKVAAHPQELDGEIVWEDVCDTTHSSTLRTAAWNRR